jgi:soluble lytic murein transglycosylase-like protein
MYTRNTTTKENKMKGMKKFKHWLFRQGGWTVVVAAIAIPLIVSYDNNPAVLEHRLEECDHAAPSETEPDIRTGLAERYVKEWEAWWRLDERLAERIIAAADAERVPHHIAFALVAVESGFDSTAISTAGAIGLTQVRLPTARMYDSGVFTRDLQRADKNLEIGFRYYHDLLHRYDGDVILALAAYNMGPTRLDGKIESGVHISTGYSDKVLGK